MRVGLVGCGNISPAYFAGSKRYENFRLVACSDLNVDVARERASEFGGIRTLSVEELLADDEIEIVLNLTTPQFHADINRKALEMGKHAYCEKPFATNREEGREVLRVAEEEGLSVGCAPDTFMSPYFQGARAVIEKGAIGEPFGGMATLASRGHEHWHPSPDFYYKKGGGPLMDMGPYYLTVLMEMLGSVATVSASANAAFAEREVLSDPLKGQRIKVETPTHLCGLVGFESGATVSMMFSFDMRGIHGLPHLMIYGTEGTLLLPDPNRFDGEVLISNDMREWEVVPIESESDTQRGIGLSDMISAISENRVHRASGTRAYHVFDVMSAFEESHETGQRIEIASRI